MPESQRRGVQGMTPGREAGHAAPASAAVRVVTDHRMTDRRQVNANLMGPAGVKPAAQQVAAVESREPVNVGAGRFAGRHQRHAMPVVRVTTDAGFDGNAIFAEMPPCKRSVAPVNAPGGQRG